MRGNVLKKSLIVMLLITMVLADFLVFGINIVSYAIELISTTNHDNVNFTAYFKNAGGEKVYSYEQATNSQDIRLYMDVKVSKEGYFNGKVELKDSNFIIKDVVKNNAISKIENNNIYLNQINSGESSSIELIVKPKVEDRINLSLLNMESILNISGKYIYGKQKEIEINSDRKVNLILTNPATELSYNTEVLANKIYEIDGTNKRIVQLMIDSKLKDNAYPVKSTNIEMNVPTNVENVKVISRGTLATEGKKSHEFNQDNWKYNKDTNKLNITLKNEVKEEKINWAQNANDKMIVTFTFAETENVSNLEIVSKAEVELYDATSTKIVKDSMTKITEELDGIISYNIEEDVELYKGYIYSGEDTIYNSKTVVDIRKENIVKSLNIVEGNSKYIVSDGEKEANAVYTKTLINKVEVLRELGENTVITIKNSADSIIATINKDSEVDEQGNVIVNYNNEKVIKIEIQNIEKSGILELNHSKKISTEALSREEIKNISNLKTIGSIEADKNFAKKETTGVINLLETQTYGTLIVESGSGNNTLTTLEKNEDMVMKILLKTDSNKYDLYKNPRIEIKMPDSVSSMKIANISGNYGDIFEVDKENTKYDSKTKNIIMQFKGEQSKYIDSITEGIIINLYADIAFDKTTPTSTDRFIMTYKNENGTESEYKSEAEVNLKSRSGLLTYTKVSNYNEAGEVLESFNNGELIAKIDSGKEARTVNFEKVLVNNYEKEIKNIRITGKIPVNETIKAQNLSDIVVTGTNAKIYYSEDINSSNWTESKEGINAVAYKIEIEKIEAASKVKIAYTFDIPENLENATMLNNNIVDYQYDGQNLEEKTTIEYKTEIINQNSKVENTENTINYNQFQTDSGIKVEVLETLSGKEIKDSEKIYGGSTLEYTVKLTNNTGKDLTNLTFNTKHTNAVIYDLVDVEVYDANANYLIEHRYSETGKNIKEISIDELKNGETKTIKYSVVVNSVSSEMKTKSEITIKTEGLEEKVDTREISIVPGKLKLHLQYAPNEEVKVYTENKLHTYLTVKNTSNEDLKNVIVEFKLSEGLVVRGELLNINDGNIENINHDKNTIKVKITSLKKGQEQDVFVMGYVEDIPINEQTRDVEMTATATIDEEVYDSNRLNKVVNQSRINVSVEQNTNVPNGSMLEDGEEVIFDINVKNNDMKELYLVVVDRFDEALEINKVVVDGSDAKLEDVIVGNSLVVGKELEPGKTLNIKAYSKIKEENSTTHAISNVVKVNDEYFSDILEFGISKVNKEEQKDINAPGNKQEADNVKDEENYYKKPTIEIEQPDNSEQSTNKKYKISGTAWLDKNKDGIKDDKEETLSNIEVRLVNAATGEFVKDTNEKILSIKTSNKGKYEFEVENGEYIVIFIYNTEKYNITNYLNSNTAEDKNSDALTTKVMLINEKDITVGITDKLKTNKKDLTNIDIGLVEKTVFDMSLEKYVSKVVVQNSQGTKTYEYDKQKLAKVEIKSKYLKGTIVVVEYKLVVKNEGELAGFVGDILDYLPSGFDFSSDLNKDWYMSSDGQLHNISLKDTKIAVGEEKEVKLVLTKTLTETSTGLFANMAEIVVASNEEGILDKDSTPNNKVNGEDDMGIAELIILPSTGLTVTYILLSLSIILTLGTGVYFINKKVIQVKL